MNRQDERRHEPTEISGRDARQGEIILRHGWSKAIFIAGLAGFVILALFLAGCIPPA